MGAYKLGSCRKGLGTLWGHPIEPGLGDSPLDCRILLFEPRLRIKIRSTFSVLLILYAGRGTMSY